MRFLPGQYRDKFQDIMTARERIHEKYFFHIKETHERGKIRGYVDFLLDEQASQHESGNDVLLTEETIKAMLQEVIIAVNVIEDDSPLTPTSTDVSGILLRRTRKHNYIGRHFTAATRHLKNFGFITTFSTLSNLFLCLMNHPNYQRKAQEELNEVVGNKRLPTLDDRRNCPFIEAVVMETLRYLTTALYGVPHTNETSLEFEGFQIPAWSNVFANLWFIHHDERIWGDPWTFRPERFLDDKGQLLERGHVFIKSLIPFSVGRRQCIGETFARSRMFLYIASLLQQWTFIPSPDKVGSCDPRKGDFEINTMIRKPTLFCTVEGRETDV